MKRASSSAPPKVTETRDVGCSDTHIDISGTDPKALKDALGTQDPDLIAKLIFQIRNATPSNYSNFSDSNAALAVLHAARPTDALESLLAVQMVAVHNLSMEFNRCCLLPGQSNEYIEMNLNRAIKLSRLFAQQMEALTRYRNRGQQNIIVQHVEVNASNAVVETVNPYGGRESLSSAPSLDGGSNEI